MQNIHRPLLLAALALAVFGLVANRQAFAISATVNF